MLINYVVKMFHMHTILEKEKVQYKNFLNYNSIHVQNVQKFDVMFINNFWRTTI